MKRRLAAGLLALAALAGCTGEEPSAPADRIATPPQTGAAAAAPPCFSGRPAAGDDLLPDLSLRCLGEGSVRLRDTAGTPTVVNLWASWCAPCREELPAFSRLSADAGTRLRVLGVASQDNENAARLYALEGARLPFPSLLDPAGELSRGLGWRGLPLTVFVDAAGRVRHVYQGAPLTDTTLRALVRDQLGVDV